MEYVRLSVDERETKRFLAEDLGNFFRDSQSPEPTYGIFNYVGPASAVSNSAAWWAKFDYPLREVSETLRELRIHTNAFMEATPTIIGNNFYSSVGTAIDKHYNALVSIDELSSKRFEYNGELKVIADELNIFTYRLRQQVLVANTLFDPNTRTFEFQHMLWKDPLEFTKYLAERLKVEYDDPCPIMPILEQEL